MAQTGNTPNTPDKGGKQARRESGRPAVGSEDGLEPERVAGGGAMSSGAGSEVGSEVGGDMGDAAGQGLARGREGEREDARDGDGGADMVESERNAASAATVAARPGQGPALAADGGTARTPRTNGASAAAPGSGQERLTASSADHAGIPGWGADLDRSKRPAVPMERTPPRLPAGSGGALPQQPETVEVFHSVERPGITPIFGSSTPPSGLSGKIRRAAYRLSENDIRHWLLLLVADRVNVVEGLGQDLAAGKVPNVLGEMGIRAEWQYNRPALLRKVAVTGAVLGVGWYLMRRRRESG
jgi:hypothetical protein